MIRRSCIILTLLASPLAALADDLPRRAWLGAVLARAEGGVRVREVLPGSSAQAAGLQSSDLIQELDGKPTASVPEILAALRSIRAGQELQAKLTRADKSLNLAITMKEWPREPDHPAYTIEYGSVPSAAGRLRTITYAPRGAQAKKPAFLIIQGLSAATLDNPKPGEPIDLPTGMGIYRTLADAAAQAGFITVRVDKAGCGDSEGVAARLDFQQECDGYRAALSALLAHPDVDPDNIFIFGHSMGGVFAPILATETPVRGVAVYGTLLKTWLEYLSENARRQAMLSDADPAEFDSHARLLDRFHHSLIVDQKSPAEILDANPSFAALKNELSVNGDTMFGRYYSFFQQLDDQNLAALWKQVAPRTRVLALWGEAEYVSAREDHEWIAALVNRVAPDHGSFSVVPDSDHGFNRADTPADAMRRLSTPDASIAFNPAILQLLTEWLQKNSTSRPPSSS